MEFNSSMVNLIQEINDDPAIMILLTFGVILCLFLLVGILIVIQKLGLGNYFGLGNYSANTFTVFFVVIFFSCWLGFITQLLLLSSGVSGLRMFFIWIVMFMTYLVFAFLNKKMIIKLMSSSSLKNLVSN